MLSQYEEKYTVKVCQRRHFDPNSDKKCGDCGVHMWPHCEEKVAF